MQDIIQRWYYIQWQKQGKPILIADTLIASIALAYDLIIIMRNVKDFEGIDDLMIINPFEKWLRLLI